MLQNLQARELEESSYHESGHESLAFDQAEARKRIEEDRLNPTYPYICKNTFLKFLYVSAQGPFSPCGRSV